MANVDWTKRGKPMVWEYNVGLGGRWRWGKATGVPAD